MLLTDDNFASIAAAVEEGRTVYQNLRQAIAFILPINSGESLARTMAVQALVAAEAFYLLSISQFVPSAFAKLNGKANQIAYAPAIGIGCVIIFQFLFSQWSLMNHLFATGSLTFTQGLICIGVGLPISVLALLLKRFDPMN